MAVIETFFDPRTYTLTYVVYDAQTGDAIVIDPVLDYEPASSSTWTESVDAVQAFLSERSLRLRMILETHAHADHLSGARLLQGPFPDAPLGIGARITEVQALFKRIYGLPDTFPTDGRQFDRLFADGEQVEAGSLRFEVIATPGHTPADVAYRFTGLDGGDALFVGDVLFMPDSGTGRCDFPGGSATDMYRSITERVYALPPETRVFTGHDYQPGGRPLAYEATVADHQAQNTALPANRTERDFVAWREARDATLSTPKLLFQSLQVNIDAGALPAADDEGRRYLRIPLNVFRLPPEGEVALGDARPGTTK